MRVQRPLFRRGAAFVLVVVLAGCGGASTPATGAPAGGPTAEPARTADADPGPGSADAEAVAAADELWAMDPAGRDAAIAEAGAALELAVAEASGLAEALGGREAAGAALAAAWAPILDGARGVLGDPGSLATAVGFRTAADEGPSIGEGMFGGYMLVSMGAQGAVQVSNDLGAGESRQGSPDGHPETRLDVSPGRASIEMDVTHEKDGLTTSLKTKAVVAPCPTADGSFEVSAMIDVSARKGPVGQTGTLEVKVVGRVDDDARLASSDMSYRMQWAKFGGAPGQYVDVGGSLAGATLTRTGGAATLQLAKDAALFGAVQAMLIGHFLEQAAQDGWESGRCVRLDVTTSAGPTDLEPGQAVTVTVAPHSKIDGAATGGKVTATLASGGRSVDPQGTGVPAEATFDYLAPGERGASGTLSFTARSRRGVGKAELQLATGGAYVASGTSEGVTFSGTVASLTEPFAIDIAFPGSESGSFRFDGASEDGGAVAVEAQGSGAVVTGSGTYTVADNGDGTRTITARVRACVNVSGQCRSAVHPILLTPAGR